MPRRWHRLRERRRLLAERPVRNLYLDTTYCKPQYTFPSQPDALKALAQLARQETAREPGTLFVVGSYSIGKELAIEAVARAVGSQALVTPQRARMLKLCHRWCELYTTVPSPEVRVRVVPLAGPSSQHAEMAKLLQAEPCWKAVCYFRPTGWAYSASQAERGYSAWVENNGSTRVYSVPYSEHSSYSELQQFVAVVKPQKITPTVSAEDGGRQVDLFVGSMDLTHDRGRIDSWLSAKSKPSGQFDLGTVDLEAQRQIEAQIRGAHRPVSPQAVQLKELLGDVSQAQCESLLDRAGGDLQRAAALHFDGGPAEQRLINVKIPDGCVVAVVGKAWRLFSSKEQAPSPLGLPAHCRSQIERHLARLGARVVQRICNGTTHVLVSEGSERQTPKRASEVGAEVVPESWLVARVRADQADPTASRPKPTRRRAAVPSARQRSKRWRSDTPAETSGERRAAPLRKQTKAVLDRIERAMSQRMYLVDMNPIEQTEAGPQRKFRVLGSTGNLYTVMIGPTVTCDCVDSSKGSGRGNQCKHVLFVLLRVLSVPRDSHLVSQKALLHSELVQILEPAGQLPLASARARAAVGAADPLEPQRPVVRQPVGESPCAVCYEPMGEGAVCEALVWCQASCGTNFHKDCAEQWRAAREKQGGEARCPCCRAIWVDGNEQAAVSPRADEGFVNLGQHQPGMRAVRDASTYSEWFQPREMSEHYSNTP